MDTLAHGLYGVALVAKNRDEKMMVTAAISGMLPDIIPYGVAFIQNHNIYATNVTLYYSTHNIFVPVIAFMILWFFKRKWSILALPYLLHVLFDIFTHCGVYATRFLFPVSQFHFCGVNYGDYWWMWEVNYGILIGIFYLIYLKWYKPFLTK